MTVSFACPNCGKSYEKVKKELIGKKAKCSCGSVIRIQPAGQPTAARSPKSDENQSVPTVDVKVKEKLIVDDHYNDLDLLLGEYTTSPADPAPPVRASNPAISIPVPAAVRPEPKRPSATRLAIGFLSALVSATIAFWFGYLVVSVRLTDSEQVIVKQFDRIMTQVNEADLGPEEISPGLVTSFQIVGWTMGGVALLLMLLAIGQFGDAFFQLFTGHRIIGWGDGLVASLGITFVFLIVAVLFLHNSHMAALNRELNQIVAPQGFGEASLANVERVREEYKTRGREFTTGMLVIAIVPMLVFVFSMIRLFACTGDTKRLGRQPAASTS
jgi:hypothetical protein